MKFPYVEIGPNLHAPMVPVELWTGNRWLWVEAYVDSGASCSIFHAEVRDLIRPAIARPRRITMGLGDGRVIPVDIYQVKVRFAGRQLTVPIGFSKRFGTRFNLLGRLGFFERFLFTFNERSRTLEANEFKRVKSV